MNEVWFVVWIACMTSLAVIVGGALVLLADWQHYRRERVIEQLDRSRQALMDMEPITIKIGTPLYDQEMEDAS